MISHEQFYTKPSSKLKNIYILNIIIFCFKTWDQMVGLVDETTGNQPKIDVSDFTCQAEWQAENWANQFQFENSCHSLISWCRAELRKSSTHPSWETVLLKPPTPLTEIFKTAWCKSWPLPGEHEPVLVEKNAVHKWTLNGKYLLRVRN